MCTVKTILYVWYCTGSITWVVRRRHSNSNINIEIQLWQRIVSEDPLHHHIYQLDIMLNLGLHIVTSMSLLPQYVLETLLLPHNGILQINDFWFPEGSWNKALIFVTFISIYWYQLSPINSVTRISRDLYIPKNFISSISVPKRTVLEFFHDSTAGLLSIVHRILIPNFLKLLCNLYLMLFFHFSIFNWCVLNAFHVGRIFYYRGLRQLHRWFSVTHTRRTFCIVTLGLHFLSTWIHFLQNMFHFLKNDTHLNIILYSTPFDITTRKII